MFITATVLPHTPCNDANFHTAPINCLVPSFLFPPPPPPLLRVRKTSNQSSARSSRSSSRVNGALPAANATLPINTYLPPNSRTCPRVLKALPAVAPTPEVTKWPFPPLRRRRRNQWKIQRKRRWKPRGSHQWVPWGRGRWDFLPFRPRRGRRRIIEKSTSCNVASGCNGVLV